MAALWNRAHHYIFALWFLLSSIFLLSFFFFSPNVSCHRLDVYGCIPYFHIWCGLSANCEFRNQVWNVLHAARWRCRTQKHTHNCFTALFPGPPNEPVPEESFWTLCCMGRLTDADTLTIQLGTTPSRLTSARLHHPPIFFTCRMPFLPPNQQRQSMKTNRTQKITKNLPSLHHCTILSPGYFFATKVRIDDRKKSLLNSNTSRTCPHNMVNFGPVAAETSSLVWAPELISTCFGSVTARQSSSGHHPNIAALNSGRYLYSAWRPSCWALAHILVNVLVCYEEKCRAWLTMVTGPRCKDSNWLKSSNWSCTDGDDSGWQ